MEINKHSTLIPSLIIVGSLVLVGVFIMAFFVDNSRYAVNVQPPEAVIVTRDIIEVYRSRCGGVVQNFQGGTSVERWNNMQSLIKASQCQTFENKTLPSQNENGLQLDIRLNPNAGKGEIYYNRRHQSKNVRDVHDYHIYWTDTVSGKTYRYSNYGQVEKSLFFGTFLDQGK